MNEAMRSGMLEATRLIRARGLLEATVTIQRTLRSIVAPDAAADSPAVRPRMPPSRAPSVSLMPFFRLVVPMYAQGALAGQAHTSAPHGVRIRGDTPRRHPGPPPL